MRHANGWQSAVIGGFTEPRGSRVGFEALLIGCVRERAAAA
ncbi:hypothetical protein [Streptomyces sp. NPDC002088]